MYWAEKLGKKVFFMNAMFSDRPNNTRNEKTLALVNVSIDINGTDVFLETSFKKVSPSQTCIKKILPL